MVTEMAGRLLPGVVSISYPGLFFDLKSCSCAVEVLLSVRVVLSLLNEGCSQGTTLTQLDKF